MMKTYPVLIATALLLGFAPLHVSAEPALPAGLGGGEPSLPAGLGGGTGGEPSLPSGLGGSGADNDAGEFNDLREPWVNLHGFVDARAGVRTQSDAYADDVSLAEVRLQLSADKRWNAVAFQLVTDILYDDVASTHAVDLETGDGWIDLRQANVTVSPWPFIDLKAGRQILTWGTGDLLFINDNFPKDWQSFFSGRDEEYLKAPSDAIRAAIFTDTLNIDLVYTPRFDADRYISGERFSYYNQATLMTAGDNAVVVADQPDEVFEDDELAIRLHRIVRGYELAAYGYHGFWKSPAGSTADGRAAFPELTVYGASIRGTVPGGIGNLEFGRMVSEQDTSGTDPMVRNSEWRFLAGYERDLGALIPDFTAGLQYYLEWMENYDAYVSSTPSGAPLRDEDRHVITLRLTKLMLQQKLTASVFLYYSPSDEDGYARLNVSYKPGDHWSFIAGGNLFSGESEATFFGQFQDNSNVYAGLRRSF